MALKRWTPTSGSLQGAVASPLLANLSLDVLIRSAGCKMVRYADDLVILCQTIEDACVALGLLQDWTFANGLTLHPEKTRVGNCLEPEDGFEFLGYRFESGRRSVRAKGLNALRDTVRQKTGRTRSGSLTSIIEELNPTLRGWFD